MANGESGLNDVLARIADALGAPGGTGDSASSLAAAAEQLRSVTQVQADTADQSSGTTSSSSGGSALDTVGSTIASAFEGGLGISSLIGGLTSLFGGGGDAPAPAALSTYAAPESVQFQGDVNGSTNTTDWGGSGGMYSGSALPSGGQLTVQVNAMDSQSFLDHSQDIANAVRQAMLNSNSLNDVVNDL